MNPLIRLTDWLTTNRKIRRWYRQIPSPLGLKALEQARDCIGEGETIANNVGPAIDRWRGGRKGLKGSWCAAFVFSMLCAASVLLDRFLGFNRTHGARELFRRIVRRGWLVQLDDIQPGDIVLWNRGPDGSWKAHIGIVSQVIRDSYGLRVTEFYYIAGNEGGFPSAVGEMPGISKPRRAGFARAR